MNKKLSVLLRSVFAACLMAPILLGVFSLAKEAPVANVTTYCAYACIGSGGGWVYTNSPCPGCLKLAKAACGGGPVDIDCN